MQHIPWIKAFVGLLAIVNPIGNAALRAQQSPAHGSAAEAVEGAQKDSPAVVPLAIPMVAGPGAMATAIVFAHEASGWMEKGVLIGVVVANAVIVYVAFRVATPLQRGLGVSGMNVVVRVMGLVLSAIAMDMLVAGLRGSFPSLAA